MFSRDVCAVACISTFFLSTANTFVWISRILLISPSTGGHLGCLHHLAILNTFLCECTLSSLLGSYLGVELLGHAVTLHFPC